jgi:lipid A disaccharide synthetase
MKKQKILKALDEVISSDETSKKQKEKFEEIRKEFKSKISKEEIIKLLIEILKLIGVGTSFFK